MYRGFPVDSIRALARNRVYSAVTVAGLTVGMTCCLLIFLSISQELSYDSWHRHANRIYRVATEYRVADRNVRVAVAPAPLGPAMATRFPEVERAVRLWKSENPESLMIESGGTRYAESGFLFSDPDLFELFSFRLLLGDPQRALLSPFSVVLTESTARRLFGDTEPLGRTITVNLNGPHAFRVTGVVEDVPRNSHFHFDYLASLSTLEALEGYLLIDWHRAEFPTYILLPEGYKPAQLESRLSEKIVRHIPIEDAERIGFFLQPLRSIHLHSHLESELEQNGSVTNVVVFSIIAVFVLFVACVNFMNLATARSNLRARDIAIRKIMGASRRSLVLRITGESVITALTAFLLALSMTELILPLFNSLTGERLEILYYRDPVVMVVLLAGASFVGAVAGIYPAMFLSRAEPAQVIRGAAKADTGAFLRGFLVVIQFVISSILIIGTGVASNQIAYLERKPLGFQKERVLVVSLRDRELIRQCEVLKDELKSNPNITAVTASSAIPGDPSISRYEFHPEGSPPERLFAMYGIMVDQDYLPTYGIELADGRNFSDTDAGEWEESFILNEAAVREIGWELPVGKRLSHGIPGGTVIGVVRDFHFRSLHEKIAPMFLFFSRNRFQYLSIRIQPGKSAETLQYIEKKWKQLAPGSPFEYTWLDRHFEKLHHADERAERIIAAFALLSVCIACFGLFGLSAFTAEQRTREIGIRKVLGASSSDILKLLAGSFIQLILIAQFIAWPSAYIIMRIWLRTFAYYDGMHPLTFITGGALTLSIALVTISFQVVRAATTNPVQSLRYQ